LKLNKIFHENYHERKGQVDRIDYVFNLKVRGNRGTLPKGSLFFSVQKSTEGGWTFLGKHFNSIQGAKKEARKHCNERAADYAPA
jgi:hypothetical protein